MNFDTARNAFGKIQELGLLPAAAGMALGAGVVLLFGPASTRRSRKSPGAPPPTLANAPEPHRHVHTVITVRRRGAKVKSHP